MNTDEHRSNQETYYLYKLLKVKHSKDLNFALEKSHSRNYFIHEYRQHADCLYSPQTPIS